MKELTMDEKMALLAEVNKLRACHVPVPCHFEIQHSVGGAFGLDGDGELPIGGALIANTYELTSFINVCAIIDINAKNSTSNNSMGIEFKGIKFGAYLNQKGASVNDNISLRYKGNMRLQLDDSNIYTALHHSDDEFKIQQTGSLSLSASKVIYANDLKKYTYFREIGIQVGATNPNVLFAKPISFTWNLMKHPIIKKK